MPAATLPSRAGFVEALLGDFMMIPQSQGVEGRGVQAAACEAASHWQSRPGYKISINDSEQYSYESLPLNIVGTVLVKYRYVGRLQPVPYPADR